MTAAFSSHVDHQKRNRGQNRGLWFVIFVFVTKQPAIATDQHAQISRCYPALIITVNEEQ